MPIRTIPTRRSCPSGAERRTFSTARPDQPALTSLPMSDRIRTELNGQPHEFDASVGQSALHIVRAAGLTGPKWVCGAGVCGACTVIVDGQTVNSCLYPAHHLEGRSVRTVESLAGQDENPASLHPVQKAFAACDGLQCGFCTPGFVTEAVALYERTRAAALELTRSQIEEALAGHLCRCGAYPNILESVTRACAGEFDGPEAPVAPRVEAIEKITGRAIYTVDVHSEGQLIGRILRSRHPHARVRSMDFGPAMALPGVDAVVDLLDPKDRFVRYVGQPMAAVAADSWATARKALALITVELEELPFVLDVEQAETAGPTAYEGKPKNAPSSSESPIPPASWDGNVRRGLGQRFLSVKAGRARKLLAAAPDDADMVHVGFTFRTQSQIHTPLEVHAAVAQWIDAPLELHLKVHASTQSVDMVRREILHEYGLRKSQVTVISHHVGGGFGSKQGVGIETHAAIRLSRAAGGRAVSVVFDRMEELATGGHRPGTRIEVELAATTDGELRAMRVDGAGDGGVAVNSTVALLGRLVYFGVPKILTDRDVVTNLPPGRPFRAPFGVPFNFALESAVDEVAIQTGIDPIELRQRWDTSEKRAVLYDWATDTDLWQSRSECEGDSGRYRRGVGMAMGNWFSAFYAGTVVEVSSGPNGLAVSTTTQDMGNGTRSVLAQTVAEVFGIHRSSVHVDIGETNDLRGPASSGSRTTNAVYEATRKAAEKLADKLVSGARSELGLASVTRTKTGIHFGGGQLTWHQLVSQLSPQSARAKRGSNGPMDPLSMLPSGGLAFNVTKGLTGAVCLVGVTVDTQMGVVRPNRIWMGLAAGRILMPILARNQVHGAIVQGLGFGLHEARTVDAVTGTVMSLGLEEYRLPGIADTPDIQIEFYEKGFEHSRGKIAGLSELATVPVAAAVANAVRHATGVRFTETPLTPQRILGGLNR